ncbi:hypothetical protein D0T84_01065 [Dysgonomonas sp. 521]|uniref:hypothetical protein n=1 Tax=Dysgonomonas sp. 521 TaxID=2302932 RepID=UPI0013D296CC|nr:hypothetical protein [Dysgonomonas sp. 521]NDV93506.1 hypothetical protein [Dysgonomonas sp. 521]
MKKFSELGIKPLDDGKAIFDVQVVSISDILNCEVEVIDFQAGIKTQHGDNRYIVKVRFDGKECKFFTDSKYIKHDLDQINKDDFPFKATIKQIRYGNGNQKSFQFT